MRRLFGSIRVELALACANLKEPSEPRRKKLYYFRDQQGLEVDFLLPRPNSGLWLIECKAGKTVRLAMAAPLLSLGSTLGKRAERLILVHQKFRSTLTTTAVATGVSGLRSFPLQRPFRICFSKDSFGVLPLQLFEALSLVQFQPAELFPPGVVGLRGDRCIPAGLWGGFSVRNFQFNLPQQGYDLLRFVFFHRHTSFLPE